MWMIINRIVKVKENIEKLMSPRYNIANQVDIRQKEESGIKGKLKSRCRLIKLWITKHYRRGKAEY